MITMSRFVACMSGTVVALAGACGASAQTDSSGASGLELEEVIVTAERVTKDLQKVSQVISVTSGEQLKKEGKIRIDEILQGITGIQLQSDQVDTNIYMRGVSTGVPLLVDGVAQGSGPAARGTTLDIAQVEVARGVQNGAGNTSLTGSVSLVTNKPAFEYQASGSLSVGSYNLRNTEGVVNLPITDNQAIRVAYSADRRNGYLSSDAGNSDNRQFRVRYRWQPSEDLDITASFQEGRTEGNGVSQSTLLYTGHWIDLTAGDTVGWTSPYTGVSSVWGQSQAAANRIFLAGQVNAANCNTIGANQYSYNAGPCSTSTAAFNNGTSATSPGLANVGPFITSMGCPVRQLAIRDGVYFNDRSNPWDDGFGAYEWSNSPVRNTIQRQANIIIDWNTSYGKWTIQPAYVYNLNNFVEPARGTSWMVQGGIPSKSERLDVQLAANADSKIQWVAGLNGTHTPRADEGISFTTIGMPTSGWDTMSAGMAAIGTNCYTVLPTGTTTQGIANSTQCNTVNYSAGGESYNYGLSLQGGYPILDNLRLNGSVRKDWYAAENRGSAFDTLIDGSGQRYVWYLPTTTVSAATAGNPNSPFVVPYRMNISQADIDAMVGSVHSWRKSNTESYTFNVEYDVMQNAMAYAKYATGATGAMAAGMGGATNGAINVTLPNAVLPTGVAGAGTSYVTSVSLPSPSVKGETTQQLTLGLKSRWFDNKLQVNVEAFDNKYKNRPLSQILSGLYNYANGVTGNPTCTVSSTTPNIVSVLNSTLATSCFATNIANFTGDLRSRGVDLDISFVPTADDRLDIAVEYLKTTFEGVPQVVPLTVSDVLATATTGSDATMAAYFADNYNNFLNGVDGKVLPNAPRWSVNLNYQHQFDLPGGSRITPRVTAYYKSAVYFNESIMNGNSANIVESNWAIDNGRWLPSIQPGYTLFDFYTTWQPRDGKWNLTAYVKNIENEPILSSTGGLTTVSAGSVETNDLTRVVTGGYANLNAPRTFGLTLSANF